MPDEDMYAKTSCLANSASSIRYNIPINIKPEKTLEMLFQKFVDLDDCFSLSLTTSYI